MRARAQKRKKVSGADGEPSPPPAARPAADAAAARPAPDPQQPPVVAPVLMPAIALGDREDAQADAGIADGTEGAAKTPAGAPDAPAAATSELSAARQSNDAPPSAQEAQASVAPPPRGDPAVEADAAEDAAWRARDEARLLVQSPRRLFLYWRLARDARELLREALGPVAERYGPAVRLVDVTSGEEGEPARAEGSDYWFDVLPGRLLRAEVGFHGEGLPFVRLVSSNAVETPAVGVSRAEDAAPEFRVAGRDFERVLEATGFSAEERPAEPLRRDRPDRPGDPAPPFDPAQFDAPVRAGEPPRTRASSDVARPASSPRDGGQFSTTRGGESF
jgi:hypothetical protein